MVHSAVLLTWMVAAASFGGLPPIGEKNLASVIEGHRGNVLVVNFWATWCGPCREEFPYLVRLHRDFGGRGVRVVSISMDEPEDVQAAVSFLEAQGADFPSFIRDFENFSAFVDLVDPDWPGALPATFVFNAEGKLTQRFLGAVSWDQLEDAVTPLLRSP